MARSGFFAQILEGFFWLAANRGRFVLALCGLLALSALFLIPRLEISTSYKNLIPSNHPVQKRYLSFLEKFGAADSLIVVLEGEPEVLRSAAPGVARAIENLDMVNHVFYRIDVDVFKKHALYYVPLTDLKEGVASINRFESIIDSASACHNLQEALTLLATAFKGESSDVRVKPSEARLLIEGLSTFFGEWLNWIENDETDRLAFVENAAQGDKRAAELLRNEGYLQSRDGHLLFLFVQPASPDDEFAYLKPLNESIRQTCRSSLEGTLGIDFALTGMPAHAYTEVRTIYSDVGRAGAASVVLVALILLIGFRSLRVLLIAVIPLSCGMVVTLGLIAVTLGRLNLISSSFLAVLFGIGIDFAIYLIRRTEEESLLLGPSEAVRKAVTVSGRGVLTGGLTTCLAFFAITWTEFVGFSELGFTAGLGVMVVLIYTFLMLPPILLAFPINGRSYRVDRAESLSIGGLRLPAAGVGVLVLVAVGIYACLQLSFDFNALHLLPDSEESTLYQLKMEAESDYQMTFAALTGDSLETIRAMEEPLRERASVGRIESLAQMIPPNQNEKRDYLEQLAPIIERIEIVYQPGPEPNSKLASTLEALIEAVEEQQDVAFSGGQVELVGALDRLLAGVEDIVDHLQSGGSAMKRTSDFEKTLFEQMIATLNLAREWMVTPPVEERDLAPDLISRFKSVDGEYVSYIFPAGSIWDLEFLDRFVSDLKDVSDEPTGYPVTHQVNSRMAVESLLQALVEALIMIVILLALDFRNWRHVLLALTPLTVGMLIVQIVLWLMGHDYNYASIAGLPLILGLGVVYGVHIVHRWSEKPQQTAFIATVTSGRGVAFAALTTVSGLCSIIFARHNGVSSFGWVILLGILSCLFAALFILPALIDLFFMKQGRSSSGTPR